MELKGKYADAIIYNDLVEATCISQILALLNHPLSENTHPRFMCDLHAGKGCVIGYTAILPPDGKVVPNLIGLDEGCGIFTIRLGYLADIGKKFDKLDRFIRNEIPSGFKSNERTNQDLDEIFRKGLAGNGLFANFRDFETAIKEVCKRQDQNFDAVMRQVSTLGGGNHFLEVGVDEENRLWLTIHSGSRHFGNISCLFHQKKAQNKYLGLDDETYRAKVEEIKRTKHGKGIEAAIQKLRSEARKGGKKPNGLEWLEGKDRDAYINDLKVAQLYAKLNRHAMAHTIVGGFYKLDIFDLKRIESVHNYIKFNEFEDGSAIVRKGAISARAGEEVVIPFNMRDGLIIGVGKGNADWNYSAPHGSGRKMSRSAAKSLDLAHFEKVMKDAGIWSTSVSKDTLDESPMAYKDTEDIIALLGPTVEIKHRVKPVYNFKAGKEEERE